MSDVTFRRRRRRLRRTPETSAERGTTANCRVKERRMTETANCFLLHGARPKILHHSRSLKTTFMYESSTATCSYRETKHRTLTESLGISRGGGAIVITSRSDLSRIKWNFAHRKCWMIGHVSAAAVRAVHYVGTGEILLCIFTLLRPKADAHGVFKRPEYS
ncbi:uncharacterized protein LOC114119237 [Aphis gossypii]|uniref:uncharacterized protein LOC114119237 n=1 Tax=Aphis gossypii TaxID=80765 RepID=UPI002158B1EF|nr:uncharacterized protein LOC114119237 [Aphis gossypii]